MENKEYRRNMQPIFIEPEMVEDIPLTRLERIKERARSIRYRTKQIRWPGVGTVLAVAAAVIVMIALIAAPVLPLAAMAVMIVRCCRAAFRAQTA